MMESADSDLNLADKSAPAIQPLAIQPPAIEPQFYTGVRCDYSFRGKGMVPDPKIMQAVERLGYRVTVGDVASQAGLDIKLAEQGVLALASEAGGHLQVAESGEVAYLFPKNFRGVLRNKYRQLQWQEWWSKVWKVLFYIIRISFGIFLIASILLIMALDTAECCARSASDQLRARRSFLSTAAMASVGSAVMVWTSPLK